MPGRLARWAWLYRRPCCLRRPGSWICRLSARAAMGPWLVDRHGSGPLAQRLPIPGRGAVQRQPPLKGAGWWAAGPMCARPPQWRPGTDTGLPRLKGDEAALVSSRSCCERSIAMSRFVVLSLCICMAGFLAASDVQAAACKPAQSSVTDLGHADMYRGWYDTTGCGQCVDYCRWVGNSGPGGDPALKTTMGSGAAQSFWSCAMAGATVQYTGAGAFGAAFKFKKCSGKGAQSPRAASPSALALALAHINGGTQCRDV